MKEKVEKEGERGTWRHEEDQSMKEIMKLGS